jgi:hypothetical protein
MWVKLRLASLDDDLGCVMRGAADAVSPSVRYHIKGVRQRNDPRGEGRPIATQAAWISRTVPPLMVRKHSFGELGIECRDRGEHVGTSFRVRRNRAALCGGQLARLANDVEERLVDLANVVKERRKLDSAPFRSFDAQRLGENQRVLGYTPDVGARLPIVGVNGAEQGFESGGGKPLGAFSELSLAEDSDAQPDTDPGFCPTKHAVA